MGDYKMKLGEKYRIKGWGTKRRRETYIGKLVYIHPDGYYVTFDVGGYLMSVLMADIVTGEYEVRKIG